MATGRLWRAQRSTDALSGESFASSRTPARPPDNVKKNAGGADVVDANTSPSSWLTACA